MDPVIDGRGQPVALERPPRRIVSLVPSTTETLARLGLAERVVGRTRYCVHPRPWVDGVPVVGGTKALDWDALEAAAPDLVLANQEENRPAMWPRLEALAPLYVADVRDLDQALADLTNLGRLLDASPAADGLVTDARAARERVVGQARSAGPLRYAYLVWREPWMAAGADTYISALLAEAGGVNVLAEREERYPTVTLDQLVAARPEVVLLPSEPFAFGQAHQRELAERGLASRLVDGELLCWHGARLVQGLAYLADQRPGWTGA